MTAFIIICVFFAIINYGDFVPVFPGSGWRSQRGQTAEPGPWAKFYKPVELKPASWGIKAPNSLQRSTPESSVWQSIATVTRQTSREPTSFYPTTKALWGDSNPATVDGLRLDSLRPYRNVELLPASQVVTTSGPFREPTKAPEMDHWMPEFNIRLRPKLDHRIGSPNSTIFVHGDGFMKPIDKTEFIHASFNPLAFLQTVITETPQPLKLQVVRDQPYFIFFAPDLHKNGRLKRSVGHRSKRHHPTILRSVLGELQNYALVPIQSSNGKTSYILLKNPKFVIGATVVNPSPTTAPQVPTVIQIAGPAPSTSGGYSGSVKPAPAAAHVDYQVAAQYNLPARPARVTIPQRTRSGMRKATYGRLGAPSNVIMTSNIAPQPIIPPINVAPSAVIGPSTKSESGQVHKTEVVETVVETQQQQAAVTKNDVASANVASQASQVSVSNSGTAGILTETGAAASQTASAASSSEVKQAKKVITKKTTTTKIKGDGTGGAVKEVSQVLEHSVHNDAAVATVDTAVASSAAVSAGNSAVVMNVPPSVGLDLAPVATSSSTGSSSSAASASNSSVKSVKSIKKTTVTKTKLADQTGSAAVVDSVPTGVLSVQSGQSSITAPGRPAKTAILSENTDVRVANKQAALIATQAPKAAAKVINEPTRRAQKPRRKQKKKTTKKTPTTAEMEFEAEETTIVSTTADPYAPTAKPTPSFYGLAPPNSATLAPPRVAGWAGPTTEPALGLLDRINTTDVPEEIEPLPDKTPREKRAELRKLCRQRARKSGQKVDCKAVAKRQYQQQHWQEQQIRQQRQRQQQTPQLQQPHIQQQPVVVQRQTSKRKTMRRQFKTRNNPVRASQGPSTAPTTTPFVTDPAPATKAPNRRPRPRDRPPRNRNRDRSRNRPRPPRTNNQGDKRSRDGEERLPFRDPVTRWIYNNMETEMLEKIMPLFLLG